MTIKTFFPQYKMLMGYIEDTSRKLSLLVKEFTKLVVPDLNDLYSDPDYWGLILEGSFLGSTAKLYVYRAYDDISILIVDEKHTNSCRNIPIDQAFAERRDLCEEMRIMSKGNRIMPGWTTDVSIRVRSISIRSLLANLDDLLDHLSTWLKTLEFEDTDTEPLDAFRLRRGKTYIVCIRNSATRVKTVVIEQDKQKHHSIELDIPEARSFLEAGLLKDEWTGWFVNDRVGYE